MNPKQLPPLSAEDIDKILTTLSQATQILDDPLVTNISRTQRDPFRILIATILSLRTKDEMTYRASQQLFARADTPKAMLEIPLEELEEIIYPVGFYRRKAETIRTICRRLIDEHQGKVPDSLEELLRFKGVGRKTANLVITMGYNKPGICVDVHVARITQRIGIVPFKGIKENKAQFHAPDDVEMILRKILPLKWWIPINDILVRWGQNICTPISPKCSQCPINDSCLQIGVGKHR
ncbi:MAG: endonuclease III [Candidatus Heimdallarchaeota archaeon]|nr:MAG: endonuclease III [Candidatus Heimdallarchaeota archaeon]